MKRPASSTFDRRSAADEPARGKRRGVHRRLLAKNGVVTGGAKLLR